MDERLAVATGSAIAPRCSMQILKFFPKVVGATGTLQARFVAIACKRGLARAVVNSLFPIIPFKLLNAPCFLDRLTDLWRYEYGYPLDRLPNNLHAWGAHMWVPVEYLFDNIMCAATRLPEAQRRQYFARLVDPDKHQDVLAEFAPVLRLAAEIRADFEVSGLGIGNRTIDWVIQASPERHILLDVKRRHRDFIEYITRLIAGEREKDGTAPAPTHDPALLLRNVEEKFLPRDPDTYLQGAWIVTYLQQEEQKLFSAFNALDSQKIHFVVLGDWEEGVYVVVRRAVDKPFLLNRLGVHESARFIFRDADRESAVVGQS
jgi:hypothetical protein